MSQKSSKEFILLFIISTFLFILFSFSILSSTSLNPSSLNLSSVKIILDFSSLSISHITTIFSMRPGRAISEQLIPQVRY